MSRRGHSDEPSLFDLPLVPDDEAEGSAAARGGDAGRGAVGGSDEVADELPRPRPAAERRPAETTGAATGAPTGDRDLDEWLFEPAPPAADRPGERAAGHPGWSPERTPAPADADFPFADQPPPHRPAASRLAAPRGAVPGAEPRSPAPTVAAAVDPAGWDVVEVGEAGMDDDAPHHAGSGPAEDLPPAADAAPVRAGLGPRLVAAAFDGMVLAVAAALALIGAALLDVRPGLAGLPGLAALLLVFSFAYSVVPLAFWGATPGMRVARLVARDRDGGPLTFGQTALRWLAGLLTLALAGLPMLLALGPLGARSPADRMSRSLTWLRR